MIDIALITAPTSNPLSALASRHAGTPPLGLAYLAAVLRREWARVEVLDMNLPFVTQRYLHRFLKIKRPRLVGISTLTESFPNAVRIARLAKQLCAPVAVVVGGPHVTFTPEETLRCGAFDFVACGEGEITLLELARCLLSGRHDWEGIAGLCWLQEGRLCRSAPRKPATELDEVPLPARQLLCLEEYPNAGALITGRGCPSKCIFCSAGAMFGGQYRKRSPRKVADEVSRLAAMGMTSLMFLDDSLTADLDRLDRLLSLMRRRGIELPWVCESRVDIEDPGFFERMARAGCTGVQFGVESGSEEVLKKLGKGISLHQVGDAIAAAVRAGISPVCSLMIGLPDDTEKTVSQTIDFAIQLQRQYYAQVAMSIATPFPGTYLCRHAGQLGLKIEEQDYAQYNLYTPVMSTRHLSREHIRNLHFESLDRLRRRAPRGLQNLFGPLPEIGRMAYDDRASLF